MAGIENIDDKTVNPPESGNQTSAGSIYDEVFKGFDTLSQQRQNVQSRELALNDGQDSAKSKKYPTVTQKPDGTVETQQVNEDGTISRWTTYKEGGFCYEHIDPKGDKNHVQDSADVQAKAAKELKRLEEKYSIYLSGGKAIGYPPVNVDDKPYIMRAPVLKELQAIDRVLEKCPLDKSHGAAICIGLLNGEGLPKDIGGMYFGGRIILSPTLPRDNYLQSPDAIHDPWAPEESFEAFLMHEVSHAISDRLNPQLRNDDSPESLERGKQYGFKRIYDITNKKDGITNNGTWAIECTDPQSNNKETVYYRALRAEENKEEQLKWVRVDSSGKLLNSSGKMVETIDKASIIDAQKLTEFANVKLPTLYSYRNPDEAEAEVHTTLCINEISRQNLLLLDEKLYDFAVREDQKYIDREKPPDKNSPQGYMRIPSGHIVARTKQNEDLTAEFRKRTIAQTLE